MEIISKKGERLNIQPYSNNAKEHTKKQLELLAKVVKEVGWRQNVEINQQGVIIAGHGRYEAWKQFKDTYQLPDIWIVDDAGKTVFGEHAVKPLTESQERMWRLADNQLNAMTGFAMDIVIEELKGLDEEMLDLTGFDKDLIIDGVSLGWNPEKTDEAELGDGIYEKVGYGLQSFWKDIRNEDALMYKYWIDLPIQGVKNNLVRQKYSRTNLEEIQRVITTYMREGDYFLENCCGWSTFGCSAALFGYSGVGCDIWDVAIEHGKKQYEVIKSLENTGSYKIEFGDGLELKYEDESFDFVYCNPPFMDEEKYSGAENDIADGDFKRFGEKFVRLQKENFRVLKTGGLCVITINDMREKGLLIPIQKYVLDWSERAGFKVWDFVVAEVLSQKIRLRKKDYEKRRTVKCHEYIIVLKK
jgi:SAM-dependent methyltransferase